MIDKSKSSIMLRLSFGYLFEKAAFDRNTQNELIDFILDRSSEKEAPNIGDYVVPRDHVLIDIPIGFKNFNSGSSFTNPIPNFPALVISDVTKIHKGNETFQGFSRLSLAIWSQNKSKIYIVEVHRELIKKFKQ